MKKIYLLSFLALSGCYAYTEDYAVYRGAANPAVVYTQPQAVYVQEPPSATVVYWEQQRHYAAPLPRTYYKRHYEPKPMNRRQPRHDFAPHPEFQHNQPHIKPQPDHHDRPQAMSGSPRKPAVQPVSHQTGRHGNSQSAPHDRRHEPKKK